VEKLKSISTSAKAALIALAIAVVSDIVIVVAGRFEEGRQRPISSSHVTALRLSSEANKKEAKAEDAGTSVTVREDALARLRAQMSVNRPSLIERARLRIEQIHWRLFQRLRNLPLNEIDALKDIMATTEVDRSRLALPIKGNESPTEVNQRLGQITELGVESDAQILGLLGNEDYQQYAAYQQSFAYRDTIEQITNFMRSKGAPVSAEQQDSMLDAYSTAIRNAAQIGRTDASASSIAAMDAGQRQALRTIQLDRFDEYLAAELSKVLEPEALSQFMAAELAQESSPQ
jgi:hypothetical protein